MELEYIDTKYKPGKKEVICEYKVEPYKISLEHACEHIAAESSIGTWTDIVTMNKRIATLLKPHVFSINKKTNEVKIAYPPELFEKGNISQILSSIAGNIFGMKALKSLRLQDIRFPKQLIKSFPGPAFGISGIRKLLKVKDRPLVGTIVKPKVGLNPEQHARVAYSAWMGGCDIVKDDENLTSMSFNKFEERLTETLKKRDRAEELTDEKKIYMPNITAECSEMIKRAHFVQENGGEYIMIDILTAGFSALQTIRELDLGMVIHGHRAMHAAITRNPDQGISMLTIAKLARLAGVDQLHIGTAVGKMAGKAEEIMLIEGEAESKVAPSNILGHRLEQKWYNIKPVFAVCSGGLYPGLVPKLIKIMGTNIIIQAGGGIHGHPDGTEAGAVAMRQAVDASLKNIPLKKYSQTHIELKKALTKWGE